MRWSALLLGLAMMSVAAEAHAQQQIFYRYDAQGRLVRVARPLFGTQGYITTYTYDDADNRTQKAVNFGPTANLLLQPLGMPAVRLASIDSPAFNAGRPRSADPSS